jgi:hypothetical protein
MPSLIDPSKSNSVVNVAANYLKLPAQETYGVGEVYSNFGTRQLRFIQIKATQANGSTAVDFTKDNGTSGGTGFTVEGTGYRATNSVFSKAIRALQLVGEIYYISVPNSVGFVVAVTEDTLNDSDANSNVPGTLDSAAYGDVEAAITAALAFGGTSATTVTGYTIAAA